MENFYKMYDQWMQEIIAEAKKNVTVLNEQLLAESMRQNDTGMRYLTVEKKPVYHIKGKEKIRITA